MDALEAMRTRRSVRTLEPVEIPREHLEAIVDAGRLAPSGRNAQPWEFIVITERETIARLAAVQGLVGQASAVVAIVADEKGSRYWLEDASAAAENMLLAIHALGYGSRWIEGTLLPKEAQAKEVKADVGAVKDSYCSDMTRTICLGKPDPKYLEVWELVRQALEVAERGIHAGMSGVATMSETHWPAFSKSSNTAIAIAVFLGSGTTRRFISVMTPSVPSDATMRRSSW